MLGCCYSEIVNNFIHEAGSGSEVRQWSRHVSRVGGSIWPSWPLHSMSKDPSGSTTCGSPRESQSEPRKVCHMRDWANQRRGVGRGPCFPAEPERASNAETGVLSVGCSVTVKTLCDLMDCSPAGSSVLVILQARILAWVAVSFSRGSPQLRDWTRVSCIAGRFFTSWAMLTSHLCIFFV